MKKLSIGIFIDTFYPSIDDVIYIVDNYAKRLVKTANVTVFCPVARDKKFKDNFSYKVVRVKSIQFPFVDYDIPLPNQDKDFLSEMEALNLDIIHVHTPYAIGAAGIEYGKKYNIPVLSSLHLQYEKDFLIRRKFKMMANTMTKNVIKILNEVNQTYVTNNSMAKIYQDMGLQREPLTLENGTDLTYNKAHKNIEYLKSKHEINDEVVLLYVGKLEKSKSILFIVDALKELQHKSFKFKMIFIGTGVHKIQLVSTIESLKLKQDVIMIDKITDRELIANYYQMADLLLYPSRYDGSAYVHIDAASQKTPTLFIEKSMMSTTVIDQENGYIAKDNALEYAHKIIDILSNLKTHQRVSDSAYKDFFRTWDESCKKLYNIYLDFMKRDVK